MYHSQKFYQKELLGEDATLARKRVLNISPKAKIIEREPWDMDMRLLWVVGWDGQTVGEWIDASRKTRAEAWIAAWESMQKSMLAKLEQ